MEAAGNFTDPALKTQMADRFKAEGTPKAVAPAERVMSLCVMEGACPGPSMEGSSRDSAPEGAPLLLQRPLRPHGGRVDHAGPPSGLVDNLALSGAKEIVFVHDDCYAVLKGMAPSSASHYPSARVHFEYLRDYLKSTRPT